MNQLEAIGPSHLELSFSVAGVKEEEEVPLVVADRKKSAWGELLQLAQSVKDAALGVPALLIVPNAQLMAVIVSSTKPPIDAGRPPQKELRIN
jgi:hypothetical protein